MEEKRDIKQIIANLISSGTFTESDLDRIYRTLSMSTHPDITGKDSSDFIRVQEVIEQARQKIQFAQERPQGAFDPLELLVQTGYQGPISPRVCLYNALWTYFSLGLQSYRVRSNEAFRERNTKIIQAILHWGEEYDTSFLKIFMDFNITGMQTIQTAVEVKNYKTCKKIFSDAVNMFFTFQAYGRETTAQILREKIDLLNTLFQRHMSLKHPMATFSHWLLIELECPPLKIEIFE